MMLLSLKPQAKLFDLKPRKPYKKMGKAIRAYIGVFRTRYCYAYLGGYRLLKL